MLILRNAYKNFFVLFLLLCTPFFTHGAIDQNVLDDNNIVDVLMTKECRKHTKSKLSYYLYISDFIDSLFTISTSTTTSKYLAGLAPVYNEKNVKVGGCSASFLCMQNADGIFTDISNYLTIDNGLIVSWFTPAKLINLELDSIIHGMVTECIVVASTKIGFNPFYGKTFNMIVSSDDEKIYFKLTPIKNN